MFTRGQMAYVQGFSRMAKDLIASPNVDVDGTTTDSNSSPSDKMLDYLQKSGASYVCLYHNGRTNELRGNSAKAARTETNCQDLSDELTSLSVVATDDTSPFIGSQYLWRCRRLLLSRNMLWRADMLLEQGTTRIYLSPVVGFYQKDDNCFTLFPKLFVLMALTRQTMKADHCLQFL